MEKQFLQKIDSKWGGRRGRNTRELQRMQRSPTFLHFFFLLEDFPNFFHDVSISLLTQAEHGGPCHSCLHYHLQGTCGRENWNGSQVLWRFLAFLVTLILCTGTTHMMSNIVRVRPSTYETCLNLIYSLHWVIVIIFKPCATFPLFQVIYYRMFDLTEFSSQSLRNDMTLKVGFGQRDKFISIFNNCNFYCCSLNKAWNLLLYSLLHCHLLWVEASLLASHCYQLRQLAPPANQEDIREMWYLSIVCHCKVPLSRQVGWGFVLSKICFFFYLISYQSHCGTWHGHCLSVTKANWQG